MAETDWWKTFTNTGCVEDYLSYKGIYREEVQVILKEIKQLKETIEMTPADRTDILTECNSRLAVLEEYAPKMMDEAEIKAVVSEVLTSLGLDAPTAKEKGKIMKELMPKVKGKADGKLVSEVVASFLS